MPRTTREALLRKADQIINDLDRAIEKLNILAETYRPTHEKHCLFIELQAMQVISTKEQLETFRAKFM